MQRPRGNFHLDGVLFRILLDFLQVLIVAILSEPRDHIFIGPIDLQRMGVLVVYVVLEFRRLSGRTLQPCPISLTSIGI